MNKWINIYNYVLYITLASFIGLPTFCPHLIWPNVKALFSILSCQPPISPKQCCWHFCPFLSVHLTVDGWNPANQSRLVVYPIIYRACYITSGAGFLSLTLWSNLLKDPSWKFGAGMSREVRKLVHNSLLQLHPREENWNTSRKGKPLDAYPKLPPLGKFV